MSQEPDQVGPAVELLRDSFGRIRELVVDVTGGLTRDQARFRPDTDANPVGWLVWHLTRVQDDHVSELAGVEQAWTADGWYDRLGLPFDPSDTGYGHSRAEVAAVDADPDLLAAYHSAVDRLTSDYLSTLTADDLSRVVDTNWEPPVMVSMRLVSVIGDCLQHLGQAAYVRGLAERAGQTG